MNLTIKQTQTPEYVTSDLIDTLYNLTKPDVTTGQPAVNAVLVGRLEAPAAYEDAVTFLNAQFSSEKDNGSDLRVSVLNNNYYIRFADPEVESVIKAALGKDPDEGVLSSELSLFRPNFNGNTVIEYFDEMKYCSPNVLEKAFYYCTNLKSIDLTNVTSMSGKGNYLRGCINLEYFHGIDGERGVLNLVNLNNAEFTYWFSGCKKLERITSLGFISTIRPWAFAGCSALESVTGISTVTSIGNNAFENCSSLSTITLQNITRIDYDAFNSCSSLEYCGGEDSPQGELNLPNLAGTLGYRAFKGCVKLTSIASLGSITSIGSSAFENCSLLATINFPSTITSVGANAFNNTAWLNNQPNGSIIIGDSVLYTYKGNIVGSYVIPNNIMLICDEALMSQVSLISLTLGSGVTNIGKNVFNNCSNLSTIVVDSNNATYDSRDNCNAIIKTSSNTLIAGCQNTVIPNSVTSIGDQAFYSCTGFTSVTIPEGVISIGKEAFRNCRNLTTVTLPNSIRSTSASSFEGSAISTVNINNVECLCNIKCDSTSNMWTNSDNIEARVYINGEELTDVIIPNGVTEINSGFHGLKYIKSVVIPDSVTTINGYAFKDCKGILTVIIGSGITSIRTYAFERCISLQSFTIKATIPPTVSNGYLDSTNDCPIYVPSSSVNAYKTASGWSRYASRIEAIPT